MDNLPRDIYQPLPSFSGTAKRILIITADKTEDLGFFYPYYRLIEEGCDVEVASPSGGAFRGMKGLGIDQTRSIEEVMPENYAMICIPGGQAPENLLSDERIIRFVQDFAASGKFILALCRGPLLLAAAGVITRRRIAAWPGARAEIEEAGAVYMDEKAVVDGQFITARWPADLPALMSEAIKALRETDIRLVRNAA